VSGCWCCAGPRHAWMEPARAGRDMLERVSRHHVGFFLHKIHYILTGCIFEDVLMSVKE